MDDPLLVAALRRAGGPPPLDPVPWFIRQVRAGAPGHAAPPIAVPVPEPEKLVPRDAHSIAEPAGELVLGAATSALQPAAPDPAIRRAVLAAVALVAAFGLGWGFHRAPPSAAPLDRVAVAAPAPTVAAPTAPVAVPEPAAAPPVAPVPAVAPPRAPVVEEPRAPVRIEAAAERREVLPAAKAKPVAVARVAARRAPPVSRTPARVAAKASEPRPPRARRPASAAVRQTTEAARSATVAAPIEAFRDTKPTPADAAAAYARADSSPGLPQCKGFQVYRPTTPCRNGPPRRERAAGAP